MRKPAPVLVADLFPPLLEGLLELLESLDDSEWRRPTTCAGWTVHDVALHLLGDDLGLLSRQRDRHRPEAGSEPDWPELVALIDDLNRRWLDAARRISPRLLIDLLRLTGRQVCDFVQALDPFQLGGPVSWAGPDPAPQWLDVAREVTERWHHQQHIRDATGRPGLKEPRFLAPILATFVHALPRTYQAVEAPDGALLALTIKGEAGGRWLLRREGGRWVLYEDAGQAAHAEVTLDQEDAWRLFTRGLARDDVRPRVVFTGNEALAARLLDTVAIIA